MTEYDVIVIGGGAVGENLADRAVQGGLSAVIVESELVGGDCSYWACMPSKALIRSGMALRAARNVGGAKEAVTADLDPRAVFRRRDSFTSHWKDDGQVEWLKGAGIDLVRGYGRITGPKEVTVAAGSGTTHLLAARHAVAVCVGSAALLPDIPGLADVTPWSSREATSAKQAPRSLAIIGGGVVAVEMATAYASLGAKVTIVSRGMLLAKNEPFVGESVAEGLVALGVSIRLGVSPTRVRRTANANVVIELDDDSKIMAAEILVATGRVPRTTDIGLENVGLTPGDWIEVDDTMLATGTLLAADTTPVTGRDWLYAAGDVNHRALLTHEGKYQARAAGDVIVARAKGQPIDDKPWGTHVATADHEAVPQVIFSAPEVASIGLTAAAAEKAGYDIRVVDYELGKVAGASLQADGYQGRARMIVDENHKVVLGVTFVGQDVAELLHAATIAVVGKIPLDRLWHAVPAYPTMNEIWLRLLETYGRPGLTG